MNRIRRHRWLKGISLLAMLALVWAQIVLASHPACSPSAMRMAPVHASPTPSESAEQVPPPCHEVPVGEDGPLCESHCSQSDLSKGVSPLLSVPSLGPVPMTSVADTRLLPTATRYAVAAHPRGTWHRPTLHPASLLLI